MPVERTKPEVERTTSAMGCVATAAICMLDPRSAQLAGRRLLTPWSEAPWPRRNQLEFQAPPTLLGTGDDFEVELIDKNGRLPAAVEIHYRFAGEDERILVRQMNLLGDKMVHRLENVFTSMHFAYRRRAYHELAHRARWLKGFSRTLGFPAILERATRVEQLARKHRTCALATEFSKLVETAKRIQIS